MHWIEESLKDTPRAKRLKHNLGKLLPVLSDIDKFISPSSVQDFHRLGK